MAIKESFVEGECPDCETDNSKWNHSYVSGTDVHMVMICEDCGKKFVDVFAGEYEGVEQRDMLALRSNLDNEVRTADGENN